MKDSYLMVNAVHFLQYLAISCLFCFEGLTNDVEKKTDTKFCF